MGKILITTLAVTMIVIAGSAFAQERDLPSAGLTPASPFYFVERFFEEIGTFFTFGNSAKAERYLHLSEKRLAEAKVLAEQGDERAQTAVDLYERQYQSARERASRTDDFDLEAKVADATTTHLSVLDEVYEKVPEQTKEAIQLTKERSITGQIESFRGLVRRNPETTIDIFARAAESRLMAAQVRAGRGDEESEELEEALAEFEKYAEFGSEISSLAEGLQTGETNVEQLVERATSHYRDVLRDVQSNAPERAQQSIERALESADRLEGQRPIIAPPTPRSVTPENETGPSQQETSNDRPGSAAPVELPPQEPENGGERETVTPPEQPVEQSQSQNPEIFFADNLSFCTKHKTTFIHPVTGETMEKEILGIIGGRCNYVEQMPNGGKMECKYSESERIAVAQYYRDLATAESWGTGLNVNLGDGKPKTTYTINGKVVDNPLQEVMNSGACVISGY